MLRRFSQSRYAWMTIAGAAVVAVVWEAASYSWLNEVPQRRWLLGAALVLTLFLAGAVVVVYRMLLQRVHVLEQLNRELESGTVILRRALRHCDAHLRQHTGELKFQLARCQTQASLGQQTTRDPEHIKTLAAVLDHCLEIEKTAEALLELRRSLPVEGASPPTVSGESHAGSERQ